VEVFVAVCSQYISVKYYPTDIYCENTAVLHECHYQSCITHRVAQFSEVRFQDSTNLTDR